MRSRFRDLRMIRLEDASVQVFVQCLTSYFRSEGVVFSFEYLYAFLCALD